MKSASAEVLKLLPPVTKMAEICYQKFNPNSWGDSAHAFFTQLLLNEKRGLDISYFLSFPNLQEL